MESADPIDISSSDNELELWEIDNNMDESPVMDTASPINFRILPSWASTGHNSLSRKKPSLPPPKRHIVYDEISSRPDKLLNTAQTAGASTSGVAGNVFRTVCSNNSSRHGISHEMHSSHQPLKRALPTSLRSLTPSKKSSTRPQKVFASKIHETYGKSCQLSTWSNTSNGKGPTVENCILGSGDDSTFYEKKGNRRLPPSLMPRKHSSLIPFNSSSNSFHDHQPSEEIPAGADERFIFQAAVQDLHQPTVEATLPEGLLSVSLLRHQKIALAWMLSKESSGLCLGGILADDQGLGKTLSTIALVQMQRTLEAEAGSKDSCDARNKALDLDDDASGDCTAPDNANQIKESDGFTILPKAGNMLEGYQSRRPTAGTLIVCPASVLRQWARELDKKVTDHAKLNVLIYHGSNRTKDHIELAKYDVVLTTYAIVTNEVPKQPLVEDEDDGEQCGSSSAISIENKQKKPSYSKKFKKGKKEIDVTTFDSNRGTLARVKWSRVVLDESQTMKNHKTQVARACCSLRAKRRWCLSGTPIQNSVDELFSYFRFLRYDPYDKYEVFGSSIKGLISRDSVKGYKKLQVVLRNIMLRRTKDTKIDGEPIITLPPKKIDLTKVEFSLEERSFYDKLEADSYKQYKAYAAAGTVHQNYANILLMLLRLRQACDHPVLVKGLSSDPVGEVSCNTDKILSRDLVVNLWRQLETSSAICLVCRDPPENAAVTMCGHVFCYQCVSDHLTGEEKTCPAPECKEQLGANAVYSRSALSRFISDDIDGDTPALYEPIEKSVVLRSDFISSKIKSALEILKTHCISKSQNSKLCDLISCDEDVSLSGGHNVDSGSGGKAIVFSQWTCMLDLMEISLKNVHIRYQRLDGTMSIAARDKAVKDFHTDPEVDVMLMSLKAGNLGLNMVAACHVILLDLWWNPTTEDQAVDRAHRIGQTRPVTVSRLTVASTIEDKILALQEEKRKMVASAFGEDRGGGHSTRLTMEDLRYLFEGSQP